MSYPVKWFSEEMTGAPLLSTDTSTGTAGTLVALLKACLITGFNLKSISSLTYDAATNTGTASFATGHGYKADSIILIADTGDSAWDGEHRIKSVTSQGITFEQVSTPASNLTGVGSCKVAPVGGWAIEYADGLEQIAIFKRTDPTATPIKLRVDNSAFTGWNGSSSYRYYYAKVEMVQDVTDINTYTSVWSTLWPASHALGTAQWDLAADNKLFWFVPRYSVVNKRSVYGFGDINSIRPADNYHCMLIGGPYQALPTPSDTSKWSPIITNQGQYIYNDFLKFGTDSFLNSALMTNGQDHQRIKLARAHHQLPGVISTTLMGMAAVCGSGLAYPNSADNGLYVNNGKTPVIESGNILRGYLPGFIAPYMTNSALFRWHINTNSSYPNKVTRLLLAQAAADQSNYNADANRTNEYMFGLDITGPWR